MFAKVRVVFTSYFVLAGLTYTYGHSGSHISHSRGCATRELADREGKLSKTCPSLR